MPVKFSQHFDANTFLGVTKIPEELGSYGKCWVSAGVLRTPVGRRT